jgi:transposase IS200 family protein
MPPSTAHAAIVTRLRCSHHLFDQRPATVANAKRSRARVGVPVGHPSKSGMQFDYNRRRAQDHVHVLCNLTKKFPTAKVVEVLKKDSSKFVKRLDSGLRDFHWQDGYGLFSVSPSHFDAVRKYILSQEEHHKKETFQDEYLRILKRYDAPFDERYLWD